MRPVLHKHFCHRCMREWNHKKAGCNTSRQAECTRHPKTPKVRYKGGGHGRPSL